MKKKIIYIGIVIVLLIISLFILITFGLNIKLKGSNKLEIELNNNYNEEGYTAKILGIDFTNRVKIKNNVDNKTLGTYSIDYSVSLLEIKKKTKRTITIVDKESPVIELNGEQEINLYVGDTYTEGGAIATDNYDGDITDKIEISGEVDTGNVGTYILEYTVSDSSNNTNSITRTINVKSKPATANTINYSHPIANYIKQNNYNVSVGYYNLVTGKSYFYRENTIYYGASLIKTLDAIYIYDNNLINDELRPYVQKAISVSDNPSHHYLVNYIGKENLKAYGKKLGAYNTLEGSDDYGITTVNDQLVYMKKLYEMTKNNSELKSFFINDYYNHLDFTDKLTIMHKYGWWDVYFHDVGIIFDDEPYIVIILTRHAKDNREKIISNLSELIYKYHKGLL